MSFKMIKGAQTLSTLSDKRRKALEDIQKAAGLNSILEAHDLIEGRFSMEITPEDYDQWINQAVKHAHAVGANINRRAEFNDVLGEVLENDPAGKVNLGDEELVDHVFSALWERYKHIRSHLKASNVLKAREDEETLNRVMSGCEDNEEYEEFNVDEPSSMETQYRDDMESEMGVGDDMPADDVPMDDEMPSEDGGAAELAKVDLEGFEAGLQALEGGEERGAECPYDEGSEECEAWMSGYDRAMSYGEDDDMGEEMPMDDEMGSEEQPPMDDEMGEEMPMDDEVDMEEPMPVENEEEHYSRGYRRAQHEYQGGKSPSANKRHPAWERGYEDFMRDTEGQRDLARKMKPVKRSSEDEEKMTLKNILSAPKDSLSKAVKDMEADGAHSFFTTKLPRNPHPAKSLAHKAWAKGFKNAARDSFGFAPKPEKPKARSKSKKR